MQGLLAPEDEGKDDKGLLGLLGAYGSEEEEDEVKVLGTVAAAPSLEGAALVSRSGANQCFSQYLVSISMLGLQVFSCQCVDHLPPVTGFKYSEPHLC